MSEQPKVREEYFDNDPTGVEVEMVGPDIPLEEPWDPTLIRADPKMFSLRQIIDMINERELDLAPDFQRHKVWKRVQKARLIESILLRIPLPAFYFSAAADGTMQVVDGLQRLSTLSDFEQGNFTLDELEYLQKELGGKSFADIRGTVWGRRLQQTQIVVNVIDPQTPTKVKFDIFKRINTGGEPLNAQEIRHCMGLKPSRELLKSCAALPSFVQATDGALENHKRMADREVVLRFCAFRMLESFDEYARSSSMDVFLTEATEKLDKHLDEAARLKLQDDFDRAMKNAFNLFGSHAFRKWPAGDEHRNPINKALFEAWGVALADHEWEKLVRRKEAIVAEARRVMDKDWVFKDAISTGTGDRRKVKLRFLVVREILGKAGTDEKPRWGAELLKEV